MKKPLLFISSALACLAGSLSAQTLTATGINPQVGDVTVMTLGNYTSPGSAGANQTWNLSAIGAGSSTQTTTMVTPSSTASGSSFPSTNVCASVGSGYYSYYATSSAAWQNGGVVSSNGVVPYSDKEDLLRFPFSYTNTYTDPFAATWVSNGYTTYRTGNVTVTADGYGTLTTPAGTFSNVMRVHFHEVYQDSTDFGGFPYVIEYDNDEYMWYLNGNRSPIAVVYTFSVNNNPSTVGLYKPSVIVGLNEQAESTAFFKAFPSPASTEVNIAVNAEEQIRSIELTDISGKVVLTADPEQVLTAARSCKLNVSGFANGIYFIRLVNREGIPSMQKLIITN